MFANAAGPKTYHGTVTKISDGDTIRFKPDGAAQDGKDWAIRMIIEDTGELHLPTDGGMASQGYWGEQGLKQLEKLISIGDKVELQDFGTDAYGRVLGRIYRKDLDVNLEMVRSGWGAMYLICDINGSCEDEDARAACHEAFDAGRGIYDPSNPIPELPFLFRARMQKKGLARFVGSMRTHKYYAPKEYKKVHICDRVFFNSAADARRAGYREAALQQD
jgi:endonuclease YncB( thermonuclease family)